MARRRKAYVVLGLSACVALVLLVQQDILNRGQSVARTVFHIKAAYIKFSQPSTSSLHREDDAMPQPTSVSNGLLFHATSPPQPPAGTFVSAAATRQLSEAAAGEGGRLLQTSRGELGHPASAATAVVGATVSLLPAARTTYVSVTTAPVATADPAAQPTMNLTVFDDKAFLVGAYSDHRKNPPKVMVIVYASKSFDMQLFCVVNGHRYHAKLSWINFPNPEAAIWRAGYVECNVPSLTTEPGISVELSNAEGTVRARLRLGQPPNRSAAAADRQPSFGLCVKSGYGAPSAERFVEWMELNTLLGVERVVLYDQSLHGPVVKAMRHYVDSGRLVVVKDNFKWQLERAQPLFVNLFNGFDATHASGDEPFAQMELLSIQDCFHRFRGDYDYIVVADIDEVIVPTSGGTLHDHLRALLGRNSNATSFAHQASAYLPEFVASAVGSTTASGNTQSVAVGDLSTTYMLAHTRRTEITWDGSKAIQSTADTDSLNWHRRIWPQNNILYVQPQEAWLHHYRGSCKGASCDAKITIIDDGSAILGRFAADLVARVKAVMSVLGHDRRR